MLKEQIKLTIGSLMTQTRISKLKCTMYYAAKIRNLEKPIHLVWLAIRVKSRTDLLTESGEKMQMLTTGSRKMNKLIIKDH